MASTHSVDISTVSATDNLGHSADTSDPICIAEEEDRHNELEKSMFVSGRRLLGIP
jgi:hypothetical protein